MQVDGLIVSTDILFQFMLSIILVTATAFFTKA